MINKKIDEAIEISYELGNEKLCQLLQDIKEYKIQENRNPYEYNEDGMYLVGEDLNPGIYKVLSINDCGFIEVYKKPKFNHTNRIIDEKVIEQLYVELICGQYVRLIDCKLIKTKVV